MYYVILQILLKLQGKVLDTYQGINSMEQGGSGLGLFATIRGMYVDFLAFTVHGNVLVNNIFSFTACAALVLLVAYLLVRSMLRRKWWKNPAFFVIIILLAAGLPLLTNVILVISPNLTYHLLMRYQWVLYLILMLAFVDRYASEDGKTDIGIQWVALLAAGILVFNYGVSDNIGYSNLEKNTRRPMRTVYVCWTGSSRRKGTIREFPLHWWVSSGMMNSPLRILPEKSRTV